MAVDTTQLVFYPNLDHSHNQLGRIYPDVPSPVNLDSHLSQFIPSQIDLASQMTFHAYMVSDFSQDHAFFLHPQNFPQDQQWTAKQICSPRHDASLSSLLQSHQPRTFNQQDSDHHMAACMERPCQVVDITEHTSPDTFMHSHQLQLKSFPVRHVRYQSLLDFGDDLLRNSHDMVNEELFAEWYLGHEEQGASQPDHDRSIQWRTASGFASPRGSTSPISGNPVNPGPVTHLQASERKEPHLMTPPHGDSNEFYKRKPRILASRGEHPIIWPVLRTQTSPIDPDVVSTDRALSLKYLNSTFTLHKHNQQATVRPQREKLSKAQKRRNHILHEQKRRAMIKDGFDDLLNLVPGLKDQGLSKSVILLKAAEWLGSLASGNETLRAQANALEGTSLRSTNREVTGAPAVDG